MGVKYGNPAIIKKFQERVNRGMTVVDAAKEIGVHPQVFYDWSSRGKRKQVSRPKRRKSKVTVLPIPSFEQPSETGRIFALVGAPKAVMEAIRSVL